VRIDVVLCCCKDRTKARLGANKKRLANRTKPASHPQGQVQRPHRTRLPAPPATAAAAARRKRLDVQQLDAAVDSGDPPARRPSEQPAGHLDGVEAQPGCWLVGGGGERVVLLVGAVGVRVWGVCVWSGWGEGVKRGRAGCMALLLLLDGGVQRPCMRIVCMACVSVHACNRVHACMLAATTQSHPTHACCPQLPPPPPHPTPEPQTKTHDA